jgi:hypothetical protein
MKVAMPGLIPGTIMFYVIREAKVVKQLEPDHTRASLGHVLKSRNVAQPSA